MLVFFICECFSWGNSDGIIGVYVYGIEVFD